MTLLNAPQYDDRKEKRKTGLLVGGGILLAVLVVACLGGYLLGHGWFFSNLGAEHRVSTFFDALEAKDYGKAYGIYYNDPDWAQHPQKYDYTLQRFTEDWTTESPVKAPITSHHIDISKTEWDRKLRDRHHCCDAGERRPQGVHVLHPQGWNAGMARSA